MSGCSVFSWYSYFLDQVPCEYAVCLDTVPIPILFITRVWYREFWWLVVKTIVNNILTHSELILWYNEIILKIIWNHSQSGYFSWWSCLHLAGHDYDRRRHRRGQLWQVKESDLHRLVPISLASWWDFPNTDHQVIISCKIGALAGSSSIVLTHTYTYLGSYTHTQLCTAIHTHIHTLTFLRM